MKKLIIFLFLIPLYAFSQQQIISQPNNGLILNIPLTEQGYYCDGVYDTNTDFSEYVDKLNFDDFTITCEFKADESRRQWVFVLGGGWRLIGFKISKYNTISLTANNQDVKLETNASIELNKWYSATITYKNNVASIYLDTEKVGKQSLTFDKGYHSTGKDISSTNYSNGTAFKGYIRNFKVYDHALSNADINALYGTTTSAVKAPLITFNNPTNIVIDVNQPKYTINACIESDEALKSYNIFVNGYASRGFIPAKTADCDFRIEKTIELLEGNNTIKIIAENSGGSTVSSTYTINYKKASTDITAPEIIITSPNVTRAAIVTEVKKELVIQGIVKDESGVFEVFVNGKEAFVDAQGNFSAKVFLAIGENKFKVTATDAKQNTTTKEFTIDRKSNLNEEIVNNNTPALKTGKYYALIIGVQDYRDENISDLDNPVGDAQSLSQALSKNYTFESQNIKFLSNPTRKEITQALEFYYDNITKEDNLLIFYAGHGYWDEKFEQGYWLASDAERGNRGTWLSNGTIRDYMRAIPAKHSLLITDACFGGGIFKSRNAFANASTAVNQLNKLPSRKAMTSGALSEVPDKSVFIEYLVKRLDENAEKYLSSEQLFASFKIAVINNSANGQVPQYGEVKATGDEGGDFIFIKR